MLHTQWGTLVDFLGCERVPACIAVMVSFSTFAAWRLDDLVVGRVAKRAGRLLEDHNRINFMAVLFSNGLGKLVAAMIALIRVSRFESAFESIAVATTALWAFRTCCFLKHL